MRSGVRNIATLFSLRPLVRLRGPGRGVGGDRDLFLASQFPGSPADAGKIRFRLERISGSER